MAYRHNGRMSQDPIDAFIARNRLQIARDLDGDPVFMAQSAYSLQWIEERSPEVKFADLKVSSG